MASDPNIPIVNAGLLYINGLNLSTTAPSQLVTVSPGQCRDTSDSNDMFLSVPVVVNGGVVGVNGVDQAPLTVDTLLYAVYLIGDSTDVQPTAGLLSLNYVNPLLPFGYNMFRRIGWVVTNDSSNILQFFQYGSGSDKQYYYDEGVGGLDDGGATTFSEVVLAPFVPPIATEVKFAYFYETAGTSSTLNLQPYASNNMVEATVLFSPFAIGTDYKGNIICPCTLDTVGYPAIKYKVSAGDLLSLSITGFVDYL